MKVLRACVLTAVLAATLSLGASVALLGEDTTVRETRDRNEIEALMWKYTRALDKGDGARLALETVAETLRGDLDRDLALQPRIASLVHVAHPPRADGCENLVRSKSGPWCERHAEPEL